MGTTLLSKRAQGRTSGICIQGTAQTLMLKCQGNWLRRTAVVISKMEVRSWGERTSIAKLLERVLVLHIASGWLNWDESAIVGKVMERGFVLRTASGWLNLGERIIIGKVVERVFIVHTVCG